MTTIGTFGYLIGRKKRIMRVQNDAELLWQILVREIYILMKHFGSKELLQESFEKIKVVKSEPKEGDIEKCKIFTNLESIDSQYGWSELLHYCQGSFINLLETGSILKQDVDEMGYVFILDFNKGQVKFYNKNLHGKIEDLNTASIEEIMDFEEMPDISYNKIISNMKEKFADYYDKYSKIKEELERLTNLKNNARDQGAANIEEKVNKLIDEMDWELKVLNLGRRVFYNRLKDLDLIDEES
jgi:DNA-binding protein H-NS